MLVQAHNRPHNATAIDCLAMRLLNPVDNPDIKYAVI